MITGYMHTVQLSVFVKSVGLGFLMGILFSAVIFLNTVAGRRTLIVFLRDILFFVSASVFTFMFILEYNAGILRFYIFAGELIGFILFYIYPAEILRRIFSAFYNFFHKRLSRIKERLVKKKTELSVKNGDSAVKRRKIKDNAVLTRRNTERKNRYAKKAEGNLKRKKLQKNS